MLQRSLLLGSKRSLNARLFGLQQCVYVANRPLLTTLVPQVKPLFLSPFSKAFSTTNAPEAIKWESGDRKYLERRLKSFGRNFEVKSMAQSAGVSAAEWASATAQFRRSLLSDPIQHFKSEEEMKAFFEEVRNKNNSGPLIFYPLFLTFARINGFVNELSSESIASLQELTDLRLPHTWFPKARAMRRKIIYHGGPTNSGKTYEALQRLMLAENGGGLYCGPLRLLALEIYETLNMNGVYCSLVTGEEKREVPMSTHVSCTVEMCSAGSQYDVAVVDEIQMIGDPDRGWAWTRALSCLQAQEIHVCGSLEAVDLVRKFAEVAGDDFELKTYERRSPLSIEKAALGSYDKIRKGDCVVGFSRRRVFQIKREIEMATGLRCCIIYGQLPPETRSQQARLFNEPDNGYDVLVASDAIGMGLNLNIHRIVFDSVLKFDGADMVDISSSLTKQIAGRAGRSGSDYSHGLATTLAPADLSYVQGAYREEPRALTAAGLFPSSEQMVEFAKQMPETTDLGQLLEKYVSLARLDGAYFMCKFADIKQAAGLLTEFKMDLQERFTFCMAPVNLRNPLSRKIFTDYAMAHSEGREVPLDIFLPRFAPKNELALRDIEIKAKIIDVYLWLSYRFPETFKMQDQAIELKSRVLELVEEGLVNVTYSKEKTQAKRGAWNEDRTKFIRFAN
ncbi:ATP-dependent RNA helicase SUPV3L1 [Thraustotheca clavata]|uniref:RNA helicase n=1 Tax=Thraustotheca clavata TaxID=74557 RepID=A0A1V9ZA53_9STRA|nr:ATP-dependent RNA helicase SUPV3L1 [Thraustotheca clavata]